MQRKDVQDLAYQAMQSTKVALVQLVLRAYDAGYEQGKYDAEVEATADDCSGMCGQ